MESSLPAIGEMHLCVKQFSQADSLRLRNTLVQILEELKQRRKNDVENEERVKALVQEKYELERRKEAADTKMRIALDDHRKQVQDMERKHAEETKNIEEQMKQHEINKDCMETEMIALKDQIRNLQLRKYTLEKNLRDQERKFQLEVQSSEKHLHQMSIVEQEFREIRNRCKEITENDIDHLQKEVEEAVKLNKELTYINLHQKCIVSKQESDIHELQATLVEVRGQLKNKQDQNTPIFELQLQVNTLKHELKDLTDAYNELQLEGSASKEKYKETLSKLEEAHRLLERHIESAEKYRKEIGESEKNCTCLQEEVSKLKQAVDNTTTALDIEKNIHTESLNEWKQQEDTWKKQVECLERDLATQKQINADLEELNTNWSQQNVQLTKELDSVKALLNKPKEEKEGQTELSLLNMFDTACQIQPEVNTREIQVDGPSYKQAYCQTFVPVMVYSSSQTIQAPIANRYSQTLESQLCNVAIQTDVQERTSPHRSDIAIQTDVQERKSSQISDFSRQTERPENILINVADPPTVDLEITPNIHANNTVLCCTGSSGMEADNVVEYLGEKNDGTCTKENVLTTYSSEMAKMMTDKLECEDTDNKCTSGKENYNYGPDKTLHCNDKDQTEANATGNTVQDTTQYTEPQTEIAVSEECTITVESYSCSSVTATSASDRKETCTIGETAEKFYKVSTDNEISNIGNKEEEYLIEVLRSSRKHRYGRNDSEKVQGKANDVVSSSSEGSTSGVRESPGRARLKLLGQGKSRMAYSCLPVADASPLRKSFTLPSSNPVNSPVRKQPHGSSTSLAENLSQSSLSYHRASIVQSPVKSSPTRSQLPILIKPSTSNRSSGHVQKKPKRIEGILKDIDLGRDKNKKNVTFGSVMQRDYERLPESDDPDGDPDQSVVPDSDDDDEESTITNKYKRTIQQIMRKSQAKKIKLE